jgi:hypothetical protein
MEGKHANNKLRSEYQAGCQAFQFRTLSMNWTRIRASGPIHCCMFTRRSSKSIFLRPMISVSVKFDTNALNVILNNSNSTWMHEIHNACISLRIHEINAFIIHDNRRSLSLQNITVPLSLGLGYVCSIGQDVHVSHRCREHPEDLI